MCSAPKDRRSQDAPYLPHLVITFGEIQFSVYCAGHLGLISQAAQVVGTVFLTLAAAGSRFFAHSCFKAFHPSPAGGVTVPSRADVTGPSEGRGLPGADHLFLTSA